MKYFSVVLDLRSESQYCVHPGKVSTGRSAINFVATDEKRAEELIWENFGQRMVAGTPYKIVCEGDAPADAKEGFAILPLG